MFSICFIYISSSQGCSATDVGNAQAIVEAAVSDALNLNNSYENGSNNTRNSQYNYNNSAELNEIKQQIKQLRKEIQASQGLTKHTSFENDDNNTESYSDNAESKSSNHPKKRSSKNRKNISEAATYDDSEEIVENDSDEIEETNEKITTKKKITAKRKKAFRINNRKKQSATSYGKKKRKLHKKIYTVKNIDTSSMYTNSYLNRIRNTLGTNQKTIFPLQKSKYRKKYDYVIKSFAGKVDTSDAKQEYMSSAYSTSNRKNFSKGFQGTLSVKDAYFSDKRKCAQRRYC